jgi:adenylate kinase family enzyme
MNTLNKSKPLLIYGKPGIGKSYLADNLSDGMVVTKIDSSMLKTIKTKDHINEIVKKRNVTLMFSEVKEKRCLLIDDIHIFQKYDRTFFKSIIDFIKGGKYYQTYIILTCNDSFLKNKELTKIKKYLIYNEIKYNYSEYYKICLKIVKQKHYNYSLDELDKKIYFSGYNFNSFKSLCEEDKSDIKDNYDPIEVVTNNLILKKYEMNELFRICEGDEILLSYNLLENLDKIIKYDIKTYYNIYQSFVNSDIIEYNIVKNDKELSVKYMSIISIANINNRINMICNNIRMNIYISKSMVIANNKVINNLYFHIYLFDVISKYKDEKYKDILILNDKKRIERIEKIYKFFYYVSID